MNIGKTSVNFVGKEILCSGTVVVINDEIEFNIFDLNIVLKFVKDDENKEQRANSTEKEGKKLVYCFYNFDNLLGTGVTVPIKLGTIDGKHLLLNTIIHGWHENCKTLHYTWYLAGDDGKKQ